MTFVNGKRIPVMIYGERYMGILINEDNRATVWEESEPAVIELDQYMESNYIRKGIRAVLAGVHKDGMLKFAVFTEPGFLTIVDDDDTQ